jgi:cytoskeletal protein CcmA (bactofilin family)
MNMWGKNEASLKNNTSSPFQAGASETTYIAADSEFTGNIKLKGNARIDGKIEGTVDLTGDLVIGPSANLKATIQANTISISGEVHGDITARESLELCSSAKLYGNIYTQMLKIDQGAKFIGSSRLLEDAGEVIPLINGNFHVEEDIEILSGDPENENSSEIPLKDVESYNKAIGFTKSHRSKRR